MRASLFLIIFVILAGLFFWITLSGFWLVLGMMLLLFFVVVSVTYLDRAVLFFLGAREVRSHDERLFFEAAAQEAYKLAVPVPELFFYNGSLERGFILQRGKSLSLVLSRALLSRADADDLRAICFELLLQAKKGMAKKRTRVMFLLGCVTFISRSFVSLIGRLIPSIYVQRSLQSFLSFFIHPVLSLLFKLTMGESYFQTLKNSLKEFPREAEGMERFGLKLRAAEEIYSFPTKKLLELGSSLQSRHFQNILSLEVLPHEWDYLFKDEGLNLAQ